MFKKIHFNFPSRLPVRFCSTSFVCIFPRRFFLSLFLLSARDRPACARVRVFSLVPSLGGGGRAGARAGPGGDCLFRTAGWITARSTHTQGELRDLICNELPVRPEQVQIECELLGKPQRCPDEALSQHKRPCAQNKSTLNNASKERSARPPPSCSPKRQQATAWELGLMSGDVLRWSLTRACGVCVCEEEEEEVAHADPIAAAFARTISVQPKHPIGTGNLGPPLRVRADASSLRVSLSRSEYQIVSKMCASCRKKKLEGEAPIRGGRDWRKRVSHSRDREKERDRRRSAR